MHMLCKTTRENVMQHNSLHGAANKFFSKDQAKPSTTQKGPTPPTVPSITTPKKSPPTVRFGCTKVPTSPADDIDTPVADEYLSFHDTVEEPQENTDDTDISYAVNIVSLAANACTGFPAHPPSFKDNTIFHDLIIDPSQYISFDA